MKLPAISERIGERGAMALLFLWVLWLSAEHVALGPYSYVWVHDFGDSLVPQAIWEGGDGFSALLGGWDSSQAGGVEKAAYVAGQFKLLKLAFGAVPAWLVFGLFGIFQRAIAGYFMYRVIADVFGGRTGPALAAGMLAAIGLQPGGQMSLAGVTYNLGLGVSLLPALAWLHWRFLVRRPRLFIGLMLVAGAFISLTTAQVFAWPVLVCFGLWVAVFTTAAHRARAFVALVALGAGYAVFELPNVIAMLADLPQSHRVSTPPIGVEERIRGAAWIIYRLFLAFMGPVAVIAACLYIGGRKIMPGRLVAVAAGCLAVMALDTLIGATLGPGPGTLMSFQFIRIFYVLPFVLTMMAGVAVSAAATDGVPRRALFKGAVPFVPVLAMTLALWAGGQSVWVKFQGLRYYGHGSNYAVLYDNPALRRVAALKDTEPPFRVSTLWIKGVTHLQRPGYAWAYGLETADGYIAIYPRRYQDLWVQMVAPAAATSPYYYNYLKNTGTRLFLTAKEPDCRAVRLGKFADKDLLSLLNVRFIISPCPLTDADLTLFAENRDGPGQAWHGRSKTDKFLSIFRGEFPAKELFVYENRGVFPRYFLAGRVSVQATADDTLAALGDAGLGTLRTTAFVTAADVVGVDLSFGAEGSPASAGSVRVEAVAENEIRLTAEADVPAVLVIANSYNRRWAATVNGTAAPVFPVDHAFQGVVVGKGRADVVLRYTSPVRRLLGGR